MISFQLLNFLASTFFTFNNVIYKQTYDTPIDALLSPIIADIVMQDLETEYIKKIGVQLNFYYQHMDDWLFFLIKST